MEYIIIALCVVAVIVVTLIVKKKHTEPQAISSAAPSIQKSGNENQLTIPINMLPSDFLDKENTLTEITDPKILAHINQAIPGLMQAGVALDTAARTLEAGKDVLYRAIIPAGAKLANSRDMTGAFRGFFHGVGGIRGHADLVPTDPVNGISAAANAASAAMNIASLVVGQYYMSQINSELEEINDSINNISNFQNNEFRSRVFALVSNVKAIATFQGEILENSEKRLSKIIQLNNLEQECTQLLGQANLSLADTAKKSVSDFSSYEKEVRRSQPWHLYQKTLLAVLQQISELKFALYLGTASKAECSAQLSVYMPQTEETQERLIEWHRKNIKYLGVNLKKSVCRREGIDMVINYIPGLIDDRNNFKSISGAISEMITQQMSPITCQQDQTNLYAEDVQLISKNGKVYYLQPSESKV